MHVFTAAAAVAHSPSGCAILCIAVGATQIGESMTEFWIEVEILMLETSRIMRGSILKRLNASLFSL